MKTIDLRGRRFSRLVVLERDEKQPSKHIKWLCKCDCGKIVSVRGSHLTAGKTLSCGCYLQDVLHAQKGKHLGPPTPKQSKIYRLWWDIKRRCYDAKGKNYKDYGGRGITMCDEWLADYMAFYEYIKPIYKQGLQIDRIDNDKGYVPGNIRFVTCSENLLNRRKTLKVFGKPLKTMCEKFGVCYRALLSRVHRGTTCESAFIAMTGLSPERISEEMQLLEERERSMKSA